VPKEVEIRRARPEDAGAITAIYARGIGERTATFRTDPPPPEHFARRIEEGRPYVVAEEDGRVVAWAGAGPYDDGCIYGGVGELAVYVEPEMRRRGLARTALEALDAAAEEAGLYKLIALVFTTNEPSIALLRDCGYREVGVHRRHGQLDGEWKDVLVLERLLGEAST
jgi:L-amino acid N-acyltransferase YncA